MQTPVLDHTAVAGNYRRCRHHRAMPSAAVVMAAGLVDVVVGQAEVGALGCPAVAAAACSLQAVAQVGLEGPPHEQVH